MKARKKNLEAVHEDIASLSEQVAELCSENAALALKIRDGASAVGRVRTGWQ